MQSNEPNTQERILEAAQAEFLKRGFKAASLRTIVKTAGVTTGALYGYYASKEALFARWWRSTTSIFFPPFGMRWMPLTICHWHSSLSA